LFKILSLPGAFHLLNSNSPERADAPGELAINLSRLVSAIYAKAARNIFDLQPSLFSSLALLLDHFPVVRNHQAWALVIDESIIVQQKIQHQIPSPRTIFQPFSDAFPLRLLELLLEAADGNCSSVGELTALIR
jgi:hypothetical protein